MIPPFLNRDEARALFAENLDYSILTPQSVQRLRALINDKMIESGCMNKTLRCRQRATVRKDYAEIRCRSFYFDSREAITFNRDGFVGFAGWSDDHNVQPILAGFQAWVLEMSASAKMAA